MSLDVPLAAQVQLIREKIRDGTVTEEEMRQMIAALRENRLSASVNARASKKAPVVNGDMLLDDLLGGANAS